MKRNSEEDGFESSEEIQAGPSEEAKLISILERMKFLGTRYPDRPTMQALGICREVGKLYDSADIVGLTHNPRDGFKTETCHFLATVDLHLYETRGMAGTAEMGHVSFRVRGIDYQLPLSVVDILFDFRRGTGQAHNFNKKELNESELKMLDKALCDYLIYLSEENRANGIEM